MCCRTWEWWFPDPSHFTSCSGGSGSQTCRGYVSHFHRIQKWEKEWSKIWKRNNLSTDSKVCPMFLEECCQSVSSVIFWRMQCSWHTLGWFWTLVVSSWPHWTAFLSQTRQRLCHFCLEPAELPWTQGIWGERRRNSVRKTAVDYGRWGRGDMEIEGEWGIWVCRGRVCGCEGRREGAWVEKEEGVHVWERQKYKKRNVCR